MITFFAQLKQTITGFLIVCMVTATGFTIYFAPPPQTAHASSAVAGFYTEFQGWLALVEQAWSAVQNTLTAISTGLLVYKELVWDGIAWALAKLTITSLTANLIEWVNSGFEGRPAFVTNLDSFLLENIDQQVGEFISGQTGYIGELCTPFQFDIQQALTAVHSRETMNRLPPACTLDGVVENYEGFVLNFEDGGWPAWFTISQLPQNNPIGASTLARNQMFEVVARTKEQELEKLEWGNGFMSFELCESTPLGEVCVIATPGNVIVERLNHTLGAPLESLIAADEINEVLAELFIRIGQRAVTGAGGLLGLGGNELFTVDFEGGSFTDATRESSFEAAEVALERLERDFIAEASEGAFEELAGERERVREEAEAREAEREEEAAEFEAGLIERLDRILSALGDDAPPASGDGVTGTEAGGSTESGGEVVSDAP